MKHSESRLRRAFWFDKTRRATQATSRRAHHASARTHRARAMMVSLVRALASPSRVAARTAVARCAAVARRPMPSSPSRRFVFSEVHLFPTAPARAAACAPRLARSFASAPVLREALRDAAKSTPDIAKASAARGVKVSKARHLARFRERLPARSTEVWRRRAKRILRVAIKGLKMASNNLERWLHSNEGFDARSSEHLRLLTLCKGLLARTKLFFVASCILNMACVFCMPS